MHNLEQELLDYVNSEFGHGNAAISSTDNLLESGVLDSLAIVLLMEFVSKNYSLELSADDVTPENFANIATIASLVKSRLK